MKTCRRSPASRVLGATRLVAKVRLEALPEREAAVLDVIRRRGPMSLAAVAAVLGHGWTGSASRYLGNLVAAGLLEQHQNDGARYHLTEHGELIA